MSWLSLNVDATRIYFIADAINLVASASNRSLRLYGLDVTSGTVRLISTNLSGNPGPNLGDVSPSVSPDGSLIAWDSPDDNIVADDLNRAWDVFVRNVDTGETQLISARHPDLPASSGTALARLDLNPGAISANGQRLAFISLDNTLTPDDTNLVRDAFVLDLRSGSLVNASKFPASVWPYFEVNLAAQPSLSADGRYLTFTSDGGVNLQATNRSIFWRDLLAPTNRMVQNNQQGVSLPVLSSSGRLVAYHSTFTQDSYYPDFNGLNDVFVRLMRPDPPRLDCPIDPNVFAPLFISVASGTTTTANGSSINPAFSPDSSWILFQSNATNLLENSISAQTTYQLYARGIWTTNRLNDGCAGRIDALAYAPTRLISYAAAASPDPGGRSTELPLTGGGANPRFSADSRYVAFESGTNLIYLHDLGVDLIRTVTEQDGARFTNYARLTNTLVCTGCGNPTVNADGRYVTYESRPASGGITNVFVKDLQTGQEELASVNLTGNSGGNGSSFTPLISYDARFVVFASRASDLVPNDNNRATDIFVRDRLAGVTHCLSRNWSGTGTGNRVSSNPILSADGRTVAFQSFAGDLVPGDYNDTRDVFVVTLAGNDSDHDGLEDDWEVAYFNTLARDGSGDFDGDGMSDRDEFRAGTNPANNASILRASVTVSSIGNPTFFLQQTTRVFWNAHPGQTYRVQFKASLETSWIDLPGDVVSAGTSGFKTHSQTSWTTKGFYRVLLVD